MPGAIVRHAYSKSSGRASVLKAYYVERNRLATVIKTFPLLTLLGASVAAPVRYFWHVAALFTGQGKTAEFTSAGSPAYLLPWLVLRAHLSILVKLPRLLSARRSVVRKISASAFRGLLRQHSISLREVATL